MKAKATLIGGFLGSGKTTLLRHVLSQPAPGEKIAVLVNELGEVGIDGKLLERVAGGVVELANGCICCQLSSDLAVTMREISASRRPDRILIESTGIAEPGKVLAVLYGALADVVAVEPTVIVVDASSFDRLYEGVAYHYVMQIKSADLILLNKADLLPKTRLAAVRRKVQKLNPRALVLATERCRVDLVGLLEGRESPRAARTRSNGARTTAGKELTFISRTFSPGTVVPAKLERLLDRLPALFRAKGFVETPQGPRLLNWVRGQAEWEPWPGPDRDRLVLIGSKIDGKSIQTALKRCQP